MSVMLESAMVDASALRDAALKSAEAKVLEEAKPKIDEALRMLLEQEEEEGLEDILGGDTGGDMSIDMGSGEVGGMADNVPLGVTDGEKLCPCPDEEEEIEIDFGQLEQQMAADEQPAPEMGQDDLAQDLNLSLPGDELGAEMGQDDDDDEIELDEETLTSLMEDTVSEDRVGNKKDSKDVLVGHPSKPCNSAHPNMTHAEWTHKGDVTDEDPEVTEEAKMTPDMIAMASHDAHKDYLKSKGDQPVAKKPQPRHQSMGREIDFGDDNEPSLELAREGKMIVSKEKLMEIVRSHTKELFNSQAKKEEEIKELKTLLRRLSEQLKGANLQNARLLYTNQTLESVSLNERQKEKIVEAVSKAGSVEEAKVIYETLVTSVGTSRSNRKPKSLREAVEKRSTPLIARRNKPERANDPVKERMRKLAGISN